MRCFCSKMSLSSGYTLFYSVFEHQVLIRSYVISVQLETRIRTRNLRCFPLESTTILLQLQYFCVLLNYNMKIASLLMLLFVNQVTEI